MTGGRARAGLVALGLATACTAPNPSFIGRANGRDGPAAEVAPPPDGAGSDAGEADLAPGETAPPDLVAPQDLEMPLDSGPDPGADLAVTPDVVAEMPAAEVPPAECSGGAAPSIGPIRNVDGIAIATDGVLYYSTNDGRDGLIGRLTPAGDHDLPFITVPGEPTTFGLAYDSPTQRLYFAGATTNTVYLFDLASATPRAPNKWIESGLNRPNDLVLASDGSVYLSDQGTRRVLRKSNGGPLTAVALDLGQEAAGQSPAGLAFGPDGALYVGIHNVGRVQRIQLDAMGTQQTRSDHGTTALWGNGLAFDELGRLYVATYSSTGSGAVVRFNPGGTGTPSPVSNVPAGNFASIAFGRGALRCDDLYIAQPSGPLLRVRIDAKGLPRR